MVYVVVVDGPDPVVLRLGPDDLEVVAWTGRPIPELGGLILDFENGRMVALLLGEHGIEPDPSAQ